MILNPNLRQGESESIGTQESIDMTIDTSDQAALMMILSENLYKDPIGSLVRESVSNALDAQKQAKNTDPIVVRLNQDKSYNYIFTVQDFGTGISPDDVKKVLSKYAASTKRGSNDYLGYYGLGFKAPLSYTDSFMFITNYEGRQYRYMMYKSETGTKIDLISDIEDVTNKNGTTVSIQLKSRLDYSEFILKIREQLAYFEGVYFGVAGINNNFKIIKSEDWKYSELNGTGSGMHICLSDVRYDIDWSKLGIPKINIPIGLNFNIEDGLLPIPSREDIKYTEEAKELIKVKIAAVADYFVKKFNESITEAKNFKDIYTKFNNHTVNIEGQFFDVNPLLKYSYIKPESPRLEGIKLLDLEDLALQYQRIFDHYEIRGRIRSGSFSGKYTEEAASDIMIGSTTYKIIRAEKAPKGVELEYLKGLYPYSEFLYKKGSRKLGDNSYRGWREESYTYRQLLKLDEYPRSQWRDMIKELQKIEEDIVSVYPKLEDIKPTQEWLEARKANRAKGTRTVAGNEEIILKIGRRAERGDNNLVFKAQVPIKVKSIGKTYKSLIVYGVNEQKEELGKMARLLKMGKNGGKATRRVALAIINKYDKKKVQNLSNLISIEEFMKGNNKPFKVFASAMLINGLIQKNEMIFENVDFIANLSTPFAKKMRKLVKYQSENYPKGYYDEEDNFISEIIKVATENNLFDERIMNIYKEVNDKIGKYNFVKYLNDTHSPEKEECFDLCVELLKARKIRMNWRNYHQPASLVIEIPTEDPITDEVLLEAAEIAKEEKEEEEEFDLGFLKAPVGVTLMGEEDEQF